MGNTSPIQSEGMKHRKEHDEDDEAEKQSVGDRPEMLHQRQRSVLDVIGSQSREEHDGTIEHQDAPVWQGISGEIPAAKLFHWG